MTRTCPECEAPLRRKVITMMSHTKWACTDDSCENASDLPAPAEPEEPSDNYDEPGDGQATLEGFA